MNCGNENCPHYDTDCIDNCSDIFGEVEDCDLWTPRMTKNKFKPFAGWGVEHRKCQYCRYSKPDAYGLICSKKLMAISASMHVCYPIDKGTCWQPVK